MSTAAITGSEFGAAQAQTRAQSPMSPAVQAQAKAGFVDHGIPSRVSESRGVIATRDTNGQPLIIAVAMDRVAGITRNSLLLINANSGKTEQFWYPRPEVSNGDLFHLLLAQNGRLYLMFGDIFLEFDLAARKWSFAKQAEGMAMSFAQDAKGTVYFATYPQAKLFSYAPNSQTLTALGQLDPQEKYPFSLAVGDDGWIYAGIGTARANLVAFHPQTRERRQLGDEANRPAGTGIVFKAIDGHIYGAPSTPPKAHFCAWKTGRRSQVLFLLFRWRQKLGP